MKPVLVAAVLGLVLGVASPGRAQASGDDVMRKYIEALKAGQQAIQKDLAELKRLLQARPAAAPAADAVPTEPVAIAAEPTRGKGTARVALIEFSDYQCPFCSRYSRDTYPQIATEYVDSGKVKYVFRDFPLSFHKQAFKAAEAAHCAGAQGKFWEMHDTLFQNQAALAPEQLGGHAKTIGIDATAFQQCLDSGRFTAEVNKDVTEGGAAGVTGTPAFLVGVIQPDGRVKVVRKLSGARPYADFKAALDSALGAP